ncbi:hypothetical protein BurJ1DRAFT_1957 [Burkholderiales bacterium JOSHI_001]|nr:hypothetical protein BurJ1DRAFT_1957 [Burkholderiales bacterium JOSHI_001]
MPSKTIRATLLKRYTHLPALLDLLRTRRLLLLSPDSWEDQNDRVFMREYARLASLGTVRALCFSQASETFHHWKIFAPGAAGVCVEFHKAALLASVNGTSFNHKRIIYRRPAWFEGRPIRAGDLPFVKSWAYRDEKEYRIVYSSKSESEHYSTLELDLSAVRAVVINPWLPESLFETTRACINELPGCNDIPVRQSRVISNEQWQSIARDA